MVYKKKFLISLIFLEFILFPNLARACSSMFGHFYPPFSGCLGSTSCSGYFLYWNLGGCTDFIGTNFQVCYKLSPTQFCVSEYVFDSLSSNGQGCQLVWDPICGSSASGYWDASEGKCISCAGKTESQYLHCVNNVGKWDSGDGKCESACGADSRCDEKKPGETCGTNTCSQTYSDYCNNKKLVEYDNDCVKDSTTVTNSCTNTCQSDCSCTNCSVSCPASPTVTHCCKGVCGAECNEDGSGCPSGKVCDTNTCTCITPSPTCGDGKIDPGEQCERPNTTNNTYCSQSTTKCDYTNRKYCTRDSYGNCNSSCQCVEDSWSCGSTDDSNYCSKCTHCGDGVCNCGETSSSCPSDCGGGGCTPGQTRSCTANCTYRKCVGSSCQSVTEPFPGTQTCQSDGTWGPCALHSSCPSDQCWSDSTCCTPYDTRSCVTTCTFKDCVDKICTSVTESVPGTQTCYPNYGWGACVPKTPCPSDRCLENSECDCNLFCQSSGYASGTCESTLPIFGTGADGSANFTSGTYYITADKNYIDMNVGPGATVIVNSGVKIKVKGKLIVYGTISADGKGGGGTFCGNGANGQATDNVGGRGGRIYDYVGILRGEGGSYGGGGAALDYYQGYIYSYNGGSYGGGGAGACVGYEGGAAGGGVLTIYAYSLEIKPNGKITASGRSTSPYFPVGGAAGGGGGGRIYIFVGLGGFSNSGALRATGGAGGCGGTADRQFAAGGGGGGFIKVTAATTTELGFVDVSGGGGATCSGLFRAEPGESGLATTTVDQDLGNECFAGESPEPSFKRCPSGNVCCCSSRFDNPPKPPENLTEDINQCAWGAAPQAALGLAITFRWDYSDPDGDPPGGYEILLDDEDSFSDPKFNHKVDSSSNSYTLDLQQDDNSDLDRLESWWSSRRFTLSLSWGKTYYWKVRVKDSKGVWSKWSATKSFKMPPHASPNPDFSWDPQKPQIFQVVSFKDLSKCYDQYDIVTSCQGKGWVFDPKTGRIVLVTKGGWLWTFENGNPSSSTLQNPTTTFTSLSPSKVTLKVTDPDGYSCSATKTVQMNYPLPKWREIPPYSLFQEKIFASLADSLKFIKINLASFFDRFILNKK